MKSKSRPQTDTDDLFATTEHTEKKNKSAIISENSPSKTKSNYNSVCSVNSVVKKSSGIPWLGDIPEHWEVKRLRYITSINDETLPEDTPPDYELLYVDIGSIDPAVGITNKESFTFENAPSRARRIVRDGDVIVSTVRTYLKAIASINKPEDNLIVSTGFAVIRSKNVFQSYLSYTVKASFFVETVVSRSVGVSYPAINASDLGHIEIPLPPLPEQKAIAEYLDRKTGRIDSLISKKEKLVELLKEKRSALISHTVTKGLNPKVKFKPSGINWLGDIPEHWGVNKLKHLFDNLDSKRVPVAGEDRACIDKIYPYYGASGIIDYVDNYIFDEELILVAEDGANLLSRSTPLAFIAKGKYWVNNHAHILRPVSKNHKYWECLLQTFDFTPLVSGSAQPKLTAENLGAIELPFPPEPEQKAIAEYLDRETGKIDSLISRVESAIGKLKEYRSAVISAAVTGKDCTHDIAT